MGNQSVGINLQSDYDSSEDTVFLTLEQEEEISNITMGSIYEMWIRAKSGISARTYNPTGCEVNITDDIATFSIDFNVFPSDIDLQYNLITSFGVLSEDNEVIDESKDIPILFGKTNKVSFDRIYSGLTYSWNTSCYLSDGTPINTPEFSSSNTSISTEEAIFIVGRGSGRQQGFKHRVDFEIPLTDDDDNPLEITSIDCTITASWDDNGEIKSTQLKLDIPDCVLDSLKLCNGKPQLVCHGCEGLTLQVYYSTCEEDTVIESRLVNKYEKGQNTWCLPA